jgi:hypothetical protein
LRGQVSGDAVSGLFSGARRARPGLTHALDRPENGFGRGWDAQLNQPGAAERADGGAQCFAHADREHQRTHAATGTLASGEALIDATQAGFGVGGHPFLADLGAADAAAVIEYLKTL